MIVKYVVDTESHGVPLQFLWFVLILRGPVGQRVWWVWASNN